MLEHRVELKIIGWDDIPFRETVETAWAQIQHGAVDAEPTTAATRLQALVRAAGYPSAVVTVRRTVDEALAHVSHFEVRAEPAKVHLGH